MQSTVVSKHNAPRTSQCGQETLACSQEVALASTVSQDIQVAMDGPLAPELWLGAPQCKTHSEDLHPQGPRILTPELLQMQQSTNRWYVSGDASQFRKPPLSKDRDTGGRW